MKPIIQILKRQCLALTMLMVVMGFTGMASSGAVVTNLKATYRDGQVFLTWTNPTGSNYQYNVYRSTSKFTSSSQLSSSKNIGFVRDNSSQNIQLSIDLPGDVYYKIEPTGSPLAATQGLYVVTCTSNQPYYYAVTVSDILNIIETKTITMGQNSLSSSVNETVAKPKPIFQQTVNGSNENKDYYTQFVNNQETDLYPAMNSTGSYGFNFYITKRGNTGSYPLVVVYEGAGSAITSGPGLDGDITNCYVMGVYDWLPLPNGNKIGIGDNTYFAGYHENFNIYSTLNLIPLTGTVKMYCQRRYIEAIRWAKSNLPIDANRVYTKGVSASGYGALLTGLLYPDEISAVYSSVEPMFVKPIGEKGELYEQMWGAGITNLASDILDPLTGESLSIYETLDAKTLLHVKEDLTLPLIFDVHGKKDVTVTWSSKIIDWFDALEENRAGGVFFWDQRTHGGDGKNFLPEETTPDFFRYKTNKAYPAFSNCSINQDPGNGSSSSGDKYGAFNGYLDWEDKITDNTCDFTLDVFVKSFYVGGVIDPEQYNTCKTDISFRRMQKFQPTEGQTIKWKNFDNTNTKIQSGSFIFTGGLLSIQGLTVNKSGNRIELKITSCQRTGKDMDEEEIDSNINFIRSPTGYSMELMATEDGEAEVMIYDLIGRLMNHHTIRYFEGSNNFEIPKVGNGIFLVSVRGQSWMHTEKLLF
ncbi:MAG: hypothetical protein ABIO46_02110 [Chitinophagales bacterium]